MNPKPYPYALDTILKEKKEYGKSLVYIEHIGLCLYRKRNIWAKPIT